MAHQKILVIGASGSGKSTFAKKLARKIGIPYVPTDPFYWDKYWQPVSDKMVRDKVLDVLKRPDWVMDGNFDGLRDEVWKSADCIIWLNLPFLTVMYRVITRNLRWWITQDEIWSCNRMTLQHAINGVRHAMKSYGKKKRDYPMWLKEEPNVVVITSSHQAKEWLSFFCRDRA